MGHNFHCDVTGCMSGCQSETDGHQTGQSGSTGCGPVPHQPETGSSQWSLSLHQTFLQPPGEPMDTRTMQYS